MFCVVKQVVIMHRELHNGRSLNCVAGSIHTDFALFSCFCEFVLLLGSTENQKSGLSLIRRCFDSAWYQVSNLVKQIQMTTCCESEAISVVPFPWPIVTVENHFCVPGCHGVPSDASAWSLHNQINFRFICFGSVRKCGNKNRVWSPAMRASCKIARALRWNLCLTCRRDGKLAEVKTNPIRHLSLLFLAGLFGGCACVVMRATPCANMSQMCFAGLHQSCVNFYVLETSY